MKLFWQFLASLLGSLSLAAPIQDVAIRQAGDLPRLVIYFQTTHDSSGNPISMLPLINEKGIALTHLIVCSFHINANQTIHLNDNPPGDAYFDTLWNETVIMRNAGVKVMGMIGGADAGSFTTSTLDGDEATFEEYYTQLNGVITTYSLQGMDLDVEQSMSQSGITRLVERLYFDFGSDFIITLAPVATAMENEENLSGFSYTTLESVAGSDISFYNTQVYNGFGSMGSTASYDEVIANGWSPSKIVAGQITSPDNGSGYVPFDQLNETVIELRDEYGQIGGIVGWEYFNSEPGGTAEPWEWAQEMTAILRPNDVPTLIITEEDAVRLQNAYEASVMSTGRYKSYSQVQGPVDYMAMVNA